MFFRVKLNPSSHRNASYINLVFCSEASNIFSSPTRHPFEAVDSINIFSPLEIPPHKRQEIDGDKLLVSH